MALSNADNPKAESAEPAVEPETTMKPKAATAKSAPVLASAFTSGSAEVHDLVAEREAASSKQDEAHIAAVDEKLAALGYRI